MIRYLLFVVFIANVCFASYASKIDRGFLALKVYNYFEAKRLFEKALKKELAPASYGLAIIYTRTDNPFHQLDSAYKYIQLAEQNFQFLTEKEKKRYSKYNINYFQIASQRQTISTAFFKKLETQKSEENCIYFLKTHSWAKENPIVLSWRDSIAFSTASLENSSKSYAYFIEKYPNSTWSELAWDGFYLREYNEQVPSGSVKELSLFVDSFPENPFNRDAQDRMYDILTVQNLVSDYDVFIKRFPKNRNVERAWRNLYQRYMFDYSDERIRQFLTDFPGYPFQDEIVVDLELSKQHLVPYQLGNRFGLMNHKGIPQTEAIYENLGFFNEGLASATKNGLTGYIDKRNQVVISFQFDSGTDFESGRAIVEKNGKSGIIDRQGNVLYESVFEDVGQFSEGLIYALKDSLYGYYDRFGSIQIKPQFEEAFSFSKGIAKVQYQGKQAYINESGQFVVPPLYPEIQFYSDSLLKFKQEDLWGIMNAKGTVFTQPIFDEIGVLENGRAVCVQDSKIGYLDSIGALVIPCSLEIFPNYMQDAQFIGTGAKAKFNGKYGVIAKNGTWILQPTFPEMGTVSTWISFLKGKKWGFVSIKNQVVIQPTFDAASSFDNGQAIVQTMRGKGVISNKNEFVVPDDFSEIRKLDKNLYLVSTGQKWGVYTKEGQNCVPIDYNNIRLFDKNYLILTKESEVHYFYIPDQAMIIPNLTHE
jgi:outer membrane protein assembly factor BamD (BamD/ComL family)